MTDELFNNIERDRIAKELRKIPEEERTLKTLKDFELINYDEGGVWNFVRELKTEAVKWVKEIRNVWGEGLAVEKSDKILMDFFNLNEEDLK